MVRSYTDIVYSIQRLTGFSVSIECVRSKSHILISFQRVIAKSLNSFITSKEGGLDIPKSFFVAVLSLGHKTEENENNRYKMDASVPSHFCDCF